MQQRAFEREPLPHAAGKPRHFIVCPIGQLRALERRRHRVAGVEPVEPREEGEILPRGELRIQMQFMREQPDALAKRVVSECHGVAEAELAGGRRDQRRQDADERRFACAVRPEQADDVAGVGRQGNASERTPPAEMPRDLGQLDAIEIGNHAFADEPRGAPSRSGRDGLARRGSSVSGVSEGGPSSAA